MIDESRDFIPVQIAIFTISDTRQPLSDTSGDLLVEYLQTSGHKLAHRAIIKDDRSAIKMALATAIADPNIDVIISTGGTGLTGRDVTPECFESFYTKSIPGFGELFRFLSYTSIGTSTIQSRATAGLADKTLLFALPGSPGACKDAWEKILSFQLDSRFKPCNFVELMPRFRE